MPFFGNILLFHIHKNRIFVDMKEVHIKIDDADYKFMSELKQDFAINIQTFITSAIKEKIVKIQNQKNKK